MDKKLKVGEVVWAKIRGFPWWPGMVRKYIISLGRKNRRELQFFTRNQSFS
jgi:hypothetical protein